MQCLLNYLIKHLNGATTEELRYLEEHLLEIPDDNDIGYTLKVRFRLS